jgi:mono/diheme cytochrome c family protein
MNKITLLGSAASLFLLAATAGYAADAPEAYTKNCASCHGADGAGHTKAGKMLGAKDLTDAAYQKTFTDDDATKSLKEGLKDASGKTKMKPFADKLSDDDIKTVVAYVRTLAK